MRNLLILDLNGLLIDMYKIEDYKDNMYDFSIPNKFYVYKRPYIHIFLEYVFLHFDIAIWSSITNEDTKEICKNILSNEQFNKLKFIASRENCRVIESFYQYEKTVYLKKLNDILKNTDFKKYIDKTLIIDDSPIKSILNEELTSIHPQTYLYTNKHDTELIKIKHFLNGALKKNIKIFLRKNSFNNYKLNNTDIIKQIDNKKIKKINKIKKLAIGIIFGIFIYKSDKCNYKNYIK